MVWIAEPLYRGTTHDFIIRLGGWTHECREHNFCHIPAQDRQQQLVTKCSLRKVQIFYWLLFNVHLCHDTCRFLMLLKCTLNHWSLYLFPLPYILQHSVIYLLAIATSLCNFSLKWNNIWNCVVIFCFKIIDLSCHGQSRNYFITSEWRKWLKKYIYI